MLALVRALRRLRADQRAVLGGSAPQDLVAHAAELERGFRALHDYVERRRGRASTRGSAAAEERLDGAIAYHGLVRYDAYNEMSGRQSTSIALLDARGSGIVLSSIHHRDQARLYAKQVVRRRGPSSSSRPRRRRRCAWRWPASARRGRAPAAPLVVMRLGYLGPPGTFSEEAARQATATRDAELVPFATIHETVMAVHAGDVDRALVPDRELAGGRGRPRRSTRSPGTRPTRSIVGEAVLAIRHCLIAREALALDAIEAVVSHPQPLAQCARFLRERAAAAPRVRAAASTAEAVRTVAGGGEPWAALGPRGAAERYGCRVLREGVEDEPDNATRFVWLGARRQRAGRVRRRAAPWKTSLVFAGAGDAQPGLARALPVGVRLPRREPDEDRVAPAPRAPRPLPLLRRLEGRADEPAVADAVERAARPLRGGARPRHLSGGLRPG